MQCPLPVTGAGSSPRRCADLQGPGLLPLKEITGLTPGVLRPRQAARRCPPQAQGGGGCWHLQLWRYFWGRGQWNLPSACHPSWSELAQMGLDIEWTSPRASGTRRWGLPFPALNLQAGRRLLSAGLWGSFPLSV